MLNPYWDAWQLMLHQKIGKNVLGSKHSKICEKNQNKNICTKLNNSQLWD